MERPYLIDKPAGATPLQALALLREKLAIAPMVKLAYAGRLDPLASGLLPVLHGDMLTRQEEYWYLPKEYTASVVLGVSTDSYDLMGLPSLHETPIPPVDRITATVRGMVGKIDLSVPVYSSHRLEGKPLFAWAREEADGPPVVPVRRMVIGQIDITGITELASEHILNIAHERISLVVGDFRQETILNAWNAQLPAQRYLTSVGLRIQCGSGTYIRSVAHEIGRRLGCGALVTDLRRERVGPWRVGDPDVVTLSWPQSQT